MWDLSILGVVPGMRVAAPRDAETLREELGEAVAVDDGPTALRFPKGAVIGVGARGAPRSAGWTCCASRTSTSADRRRCCWSAWGRSGELGVVAAERLARRAWR